MGQLETTIGCGSKMERYTLLKTVAFTLPQALASGGFIAGGNWRKLCGHGVGKASVLGVLVTVSIRNEALFAD